MIARDGSSSSSVTSHNLLLASNSVHQMIAHDFRILTELSNRFGHPHNAL
jgi:hypothetical protein